MQLGILEVKTRLSELVARAAKGEEIVITKRGTAVAKIVSARKTLSPEETHAWLEQARQLRAQSKPSTWEETKKMVHEGHKS